VSILDEWIVLDTNIWIFGLRQSPDLPPCAQLLEQLPRLHVVLPRQILQELQANLSENDLHALFHLLNHYPEKRKIAWEKAKSDLIAKYRALGCKLGDAVIAAHLEELGVTILVSENRDFLEEISNLPFRTLSASRAVAELMQSLAAE
jgi:predicted nucleic acid-binding protein